MWEVCVFENLKSLSFYSDENVIFQLQINVLGKEKSTENLENYSLMKLDLDWQFSEPGIPGKSPYGEFQE